MLIMVGPAWWDFVGKVKVSLVYIALVINAAIYNLVDFAYQIFMAVASARIFTDETIRSFANRVYIIIGVIALFVIAYALLRAIVDPDASSKSEMTPAKIVPNVLKAIILIAFIPTIFNFVYQMQDVILGTDVIGKILIGDNYTRDYQKSDDSSSSISFNTAGKQLANDLFKSFLTLSNTSRQANKNESNIAAGDCNKNCLTYFPSGEDTKPSYQDLSDAIDNGKTINFSDTDSSTAGLDLYTNLADNVFSEELDYNPIVQLLVGLVVVYVFVSFCIDMGVRAIKLGYFELIAPFPILTIIIPGQKKIFDNWLKATISTFADVFVKIATMFFGILLIQNLPDINGNLWENSFIGTPSLPVRIFARVFIIIGIILFIKQAPQLISDITGIKAGSFKLGIGDKLREGGVLGATGAVGAMGLAAANKIGHNGQALARDWKNAQGKGKLAHAKAALKGAGRFANPLDLIRYGNAGIKGYGATKDAKSIADWSNGMNKGVAQALSAPTIPTNIKNAASDFGSGVKQAATTEYTPGNRELEKYQKRIANAQAVDIRKKLRDIARANDTATISANRNLTNFNNGSMDLAMASQYSTSVDRVGLDKNGNITTTAKDIVSYGYISRDTGNSMSETDAIAKVRKDLENKRDDAEANYINSQARMAGSEINMEIETANRIHTEMGNDALMDGVIAFAPNSDPTKDIYAQLKANHDKIAKDNDPNSNINKLRADPNYINAVEADRRNKEYGNPDAKK